MTAPTERAPSATDTYLLLRAFCQELVRCGMTDACTSPGSRSTPIVLSLAREPGLRAWSHLDERVAGFFALGLAKQSGRPVAVACTSGTAAAELAPAVIEAAQARVPLIVLTADRPPELRDVGAGQTIDQLKLYGDAVKQFVELGTHYATAARLRWMRTLACRLCWTALGDRPGPVHVNVPLREPLVLTEPLPPAGEDAVPARAGGRPWVARPVVPVAAQVAPVPIAPARRTVVVAGRDERDPAIGEAVAAFATAAGYPLLADPLSGARRGPAAVDHYDALLRDERLAAELRPELVLRIGDLPTSKPLRAWLARLGDVEQIALDAEGIWHDPDGVVTERIDASPRAALTALTPDHRDAGDRDWLDRWRAADRAAAGAIAATLGDELSEPRVAAELVAALPPEATLFVAASMPIRDVETFAAAREAPPRLLANRGANGIDGTVAAAFGAAAVADGPVVLHIGDVALAYDLTALLSARRLGLELTIVLVNNDGGGIFHFLPVAEERDAFEEHVATPHGLDFAQAAALFGARHVPVATPAELRAALGEALGAGGVTIVEARTDRDANVALHRRTWDAVGAALAADRGG